jgi:hypothetical protein
MGSNELLPGANAGTPAVLWNNVRALPPSAANGSMPAAAEVS